MYCSLCFENHARRFEHLPGIPGGNAEPLLFFFFFLFYFLDAASSDLLLSTFEGESLPCFEPRLLGWVLPHLPAEKARLDRPRPQR